MKPIERTVSESGLVTTSYVGDEGELIIDYKQDAAPQFELVKQVRQDPDSWKKGVKKDMVHAFHIPDGVVHELLKIGVNVYTSPLKDIAWGLKRLNRYEACDMTGKRVV